MGVWPGPAKLLQSVVPPSKTGAIGGFRAGVNVIGDHRFPCADQQGGKCKTQTGDVGLDRDGGRRGGALMGFWVNYEGRVSKI